MAPSSTTAVNTLPHTPAFRFSSLFWYVIILFGMGLNFTCGFIPVFAGEHREQSYKEHADNMLYVFLYYFFHPTAVMVYKGIFVAAVIAHVAEAAVALYLICTRTRADNRTAMVLWTLQTFLLGFASLKPLRNAIARATAQAQ